MKNLLKKLRDRGFDKSEYNYSKHKHIVCCSQCEALVINGIACHEIGCPNEIKTREK